MFKFDFISFLFFVVLFLGCFAQILNAQRRPTGAYSCSVCTKDITKEWCVGEKYQGCVDKNTCVADKLGTMDYNAATCANLSKAQRYINCGGCVAVNKIWCSIKDPNGIIVENKCLNSVAGADLSKGRSDCPNGELYNSCSPATPAANLAPFPLIRNCGDCLKEANMGWWESKNSRRCIHRSDQLLYADEEGGILFSLTCLLRQNFYFNFPSRTCKACVAAPEASWCSQKESVQFAICTGAHEVCPVATPVQTCADPNEAVRELNLLSYTCDFCTGSGYNWCTYSNGIVTTRRCFHGKCPDGSVTHPDCKTVTGDNIYTFLPETPRDLPPNCYSCKSPDPSVADARQWCDSGEVRTCLPKSNFGFFCSNPPVECSDDNNDRLFEKNPFNLPQTCDGCVNNNIGKWCRTSLNNENYQFCTPAVLDKFCIGAIPLTSCKGLTDDQKKALIPNPPKTCDDCIKKGIDYEWCVHSYYGEKARFCLPKIAVKRLCSHGVAFSHCDIAPEDKTLYIGRYDIPVIPFKPDSTPVKPDSTPVKPDSTPVKPDSTPVKPDSTPVKPDSTLVKRGCTPVKRNSKHVKPDSAPSFASLSLIAVILAFGFNVLL